MDKRGVASIAILPSGSISGHFVDAQTSQCFGLFGTQISCERECSRGEDYKLINLSILDFNSKKEVQVIVESHGQDAARFQNATDVHGWEEDVMEALHGKASGACVPNIKFECEILKADKDAERHIQKYMPSLAGRGAIVNVGTMDIKGLKFETEKELQDMDGAQHAVSRVEFEVENLSCHADQQGDDDVGGEEGIVADLGREMAHAAPTSISTSGIGMAMFKLCPLK